MDGKEFDREMNKRTFTVVGGDARMRYLALALKQTGMPTIVTCVPGLADDGLPEALLPKAEIVILPVPTLDKNKRIVGTTLTSEALLSLLPPDAKIFCGKPDAALADDPGTTDLLARPSLTIRNAALTAEGAIQLAMTLLPSSILGGRFLVIGAGRIGMALARRLQALGAEVTVSARKSADYAKIECENLRSDRTGVYEHGLGCYDCVFNTVPARVFSAEQLAGLTPDCLYMELASAPGGIEEDARAMLGKRFVSGAGLPGRCSPKAAGVLILQEIFACLEEEGAR